MPTLAPVSDAAIPLGGDARSFGILSTFPPTECGIATFSAALAAGLIANGATVDVVRCGARIRLSIRLRMYRCSAPSPHRNPAISPHHSTC